MKYIFYRRFGFTVRTETRIYIDHLGLYPSVEPVTTYSTDDKRGDKDCWQQQYSNEEICTARLCARDESRPDANERPFTVDARPRFTACVEEHSACSLQLSLAQLHGERHVRNTCTRHRRTLSHRLRWIVSQITEFLTAGRKSQPWSWLQTNRVKTKGDTWQ